MTNKKDQRSRQAEVQNAMETKERTPGDESTRFYCFKDNASQAIKDIFMDNYEIRDLDYQIFSDACDFFCNYTIEELKDDDKDNVINEYESASIYITDRLAYLNVYNENEIADTMDEYGGESISQACAYWYDEQVRNAIRLLAEYIINGSDNTK